MSKEQTPAGGDDQMPGHSDPPRPPRPLRPGRGTPPGWTWSAVWQRFGTPLCTVLFLPCAVWTLLITLAVWTTRGDTAYCSPPDHSGPCTRYQDSETLADVGTSAALVVLALAAFLLARGARYSRTPGRTALGALCALAAFLLLTAPVGLVLYGTSH